MRSTPPLLRNQQCLRVPTAGCEKEWLATMTLAGVSTTTILAGFAPVPGPVRGGGV